MCLPELLDDSATTGTKASDQGAPPWENRPADKYHDAPGSSSDFHVVGMGLFGESCSRGLLGGEEPLLRSRYFVEPSCGFFVWSRHGTIPLLSWGIMHYALAPSNSQSCRANLMKTKEIHYALPVGQLCERHAQELIQAREGLHFELPPIADNAAAEGSQREDGGSAEQTPACLGSSIAPTKSRFAGWQKQHSQFKSRPRKIVSYAFPINNLRKLRGKTL